MIMGPFANDDRHGAGSADESSVLPLYDVRFVRDMKRRGWTGGGLASAELINWFGHNPVVQDVAHVASLPLAGFLALDLGYALARKIYRWTRFHFDVQIHVSKDGRGDSRGQSGPRAPDDRPFSRP
jgi:hypothetical protein